MRILFGLILISCIFGCSNKNNPDVGGESSSVDYVQDIENTNSYAKGFRITKTKNAHQLDLLDPWNEGKSFASYTISPPYKRWAVSSTTHIGFLSALGEEDRIVGCTSPDRIYSEKLAARYRKGDIAKIGSDMEFNFESVLGIEPDIILQTAFEGQKKKDQRFLSTDLEFVYILEWMEPHPLGRAEWIKVFGLLTGKMQEADSIFEEVESQYNDLKHLIEKEESKPLVMFGNNFNGTWYMPGGENYMCRFLEDAGYEYPFLESDNRGSLALNFENVLEQFRTADLWLGVSAKTLSELSRADSRYALFDPFNKGKVYSVNGRINNDMGNDYWESGVVFPNLILADLVSIAHPEILTGHKLRYYKQLESGR